MNLGAFACVMLAQDRTGSDDLSSWRGIGRRAPGLGLALSIFVISLIGIPPTVGFAGKMQLFVAALDHGRLTWLVVVAALNTALSAYYYVRVLKVAWLDEPAEGAAPLAIPAGGNALVAAHAFLVIALGIFFDRVVEWTAAIGALR